MPSIGRGVEIRIFDVTGAYRVIFLAVLREAVFVMNAFQKKAEKTSTRDVALAKAPYDRLVRNRK